MNEQNMTDTSASTASQATPQRSRLSAYVADTVAKLQSGYLRDDAVAVAALAKLRRGVGKEPGDIMELSQWTSAGLYVENPSDDEISSTERAAYTAITLFAIHQQSRRAKPMHKPWSSFAQALRALSISQGERSAASDYQQSPNNAGVLRRFSALGTAQTHEELARHALGLIQQLRAAEIPFDYGQFADDLHKLQDFARGAGVRARWGREFYRLDARSKN